jgi:alpha-L-arabinofuranosidase
MLALVAALAASTATATPETVISVQAGKPLHEVNRMYMGCHSDSGFVHQVRGFSSQMVFGESFERPPENVTGSGKAAYAWSHAIDPAATGVVAVDTAKTFHGRESRKLSMSAGTGTVGIANRALANEGMYFEARKEYEGYFFATSAAAVTLEVRLEDYVTKAVLARQTIAFGGGAWAMQNFSLTPSAATTCEGIAIGSDPDVICTQPTNEAGHSCIRCSGQFVVALASPGEVNIDFVVLQPGEWGRLAGLPVRKQTTDILQRMGISAIRCGGSFASVTAWPDGGGGTPPSNVSGEWYQWQKWTGPVWARPSIGAVWNAYSGNSYSLIGGWGPFEVIDMAAAIGAEPIITTASSSTPESFADLVEYCWGNESTPMGRKRTADGHPGQYKLKYIELGNEQYNDQFVEQVAAMEARAKQVGVGGQLKYIFPSNGGLNPADTIKAKALGMDAQMAADIHVGGGGGVAVAVADFKAEGDFTISAINQETNAGTHDQGRAISEAADLNKFFSADGALQKRILGRTASFCTERSGHYDMFDQGVSFFLPNASWLQPPGHVHAMVHESWQPMALNVSVETTGLAPPEWAMYKDKGYTCSGAEYRGTAADANKTAAGCLAAAEGMIAAGVNYATYPGNGCFVCSVAGDVASKLQTKPGQITYVGKHINPPMSVSAQQSADGGTVVVRIVNGAGSLASITLHVTPEGASDAWYSAATAMQLQSDALSDANPSWDVDKISPKAVKVEMTAGKAALTLPVFSYTVVTVTK